MNKTIITRTRAVTIGTVLALGFSAFSASADNLSTTTSAGGEVNQYTVRYADLDVAKIAGASALYSRINHAAQKVCQPLESRELGIAAKYRACMQQAVDKAVADVDSPVLSQYHELHTKGDKAGQVRLAQAN